MMQEKLKEELKRLTNDDLDIILDELNTINIDLPDESREEKINLILFNSEGKEKEILKRISEIREKNKEKYASLGI